MLCEFSFKKNNNNKENASRLNALVQVNLSSFHFLFEKKTFEEKNGKTVKFWIRIKFFQHFFFLFSVHCGFFDAQNCLFSLFLSCFLFLSEHTFFICMNLKMILYNRKYISYDSIEKKSLQNRSRFTFCREKRSFFRLTIATDWYIEQKKLRRSFKLTCLLFFFLFL